MLSEVSIIDELKLNCGKGKFVIVNTYVIFDFMHTFMDGWYLTYIHMWIEKFYTHTYTQQVNDPFYGEPVLFHDQIGENYYNKQ